MHTSLVFAFDSMDKPSVNRIPHTGIMDLLAFTDTHSCHIC